MTATEELRRMLDERGVDYMVSATGRSIEIGGPYTTAYANRTDATLDVALLQVTPEQAIAATLGPGTCEVEGYDDGVDEGMDGEWYSYGPPTWHLSCGHETYGSERPCYCCTCGRKVN